MAEPELGPSRICSEAQAFVSAELGRIVCLELQFVILKKIKSFILKNAFRRLCHGIHLSAAISMCGAVGGGGAYTLYSLESAYLARWFSTQSAH